MSRSPKGLTIPSRPARPCVSCGKLGKDTRCGECQKRADRLRNAARPQYQGDWARIRRQVLERDDHICWKCGGPADTVDHVRPVAHGGTNDPANLAAACATCNFRSGGSVRRSR